MKILMQALLISAALHVIYFITTLAVGYAKTALYQPNVMEAWQNVETLQSEVAFGSTVSPFFHVSTFLGGALLCWILLFSCQKMSVRSKQQEVK